MVKFICKESCVNHDYWMCSCETIGCSEHILNHCHFSADSIQISRNPDSISRYKKKDNFLTYKNIFILNSCMKIRSISANNHLNFAFICMKHNKFFKISYDFPSNMNEPLINFNLKQIEGTENHFSESLSKIYKTHQVLTISQISNDGKFILHAECSWVKSLNRISICYLNSNKKRAKLVDMVFIRAAIITPDSKQFVLGSSDNLITIWSVSKFSQKFELNGHKNWVTSLKVTNSKNLLVSGSYDNTVRVWHFRSGKCLKVLYGHSEPVTCVNFNFNCTVIVSGSIDAQIKIWSTFSFELIANLKGHELGITVLEPFAKSNFLISGGYDGKIQIWDLQTFQIERTMDYLKSRVTFILICGNDNYLTAGGAVDKITVMWSLIHNKIIRVYTRVKGNANCVTLTVDKTHALIGYNIGTILIFEFESFIRRIFKAHDSEINNLCVSSKKSIIVSASSYEEIKVWDFFTLEILFQTKIECILINIGLFEKKNMIFATDINKNYHFISFKECNEENNFKEIRKRKKILKHVSFSRKFFGFMLYKNRLRLK